MNPEDVPQTLVQVAAQVIDPDAFEVPLRGYSEGAAAQSRDDARARASEILAGVLPLYGYMLAKELSNDGMQQYDPVPSWALKQLRGETGI